jgi:5-formyltetrahydrofolate cyclo-ligase
MSLSPSKSALRAQLKARRAAVDLETRAQAGEFAASALLELSQATTVIALYHATASEFPTQQLAESLWGRGQKIVLPVIGTQGSLSFRQWHPADTLHTSSLNTLEPSAHAESVSISHIDLVVVPVVGFDQRGTRLGMGGGYYDRTLADATATLKIGLAYDCQEVEALTVEPHDIALDYVITESRIITCCSSDTQATHSAQYPRPHQSD